MGERAEIRAACEWKCCLIPLRHSFANWRAARTNGPTDGQRIRPKDRAELAVTSNSEEAETEAEAEAEAEKEPGKE